MPHAVGERVRTAKLTAAQVVRLRERAAGNVPLVVLAREAGITPTALGHVIHGTTWRHVGGPIRPKRDHRLAFHGPRYCPHDGYALEHDTDGAGHEVARCVACERRRAGRCMECGRRVEGKAWRCPTHRDAAQRRALDEYKIRHREEVNRRAVAAIRRETPEERAHRLAVKKAWRERNRRAVYMHKRKARLEGRPNGYATREKYEAYQRAYRERNREALREKMRTRYYELHPVRPAPTCVDCGAAVPWRGTGRPAKRCPEHRVAGGAAAKVAA
jgi:putative hemolysin